MTGRQIVKRLLEIYKPAFHKCEDPETGYWVEIPEFPGCVSEGETLEEAREMIEEAAEGWLLCTLEASADSKSTSERPDDASGEDKPSVPVDEARRAASIAYLERYGAVFNKDKTRIIRVIPM